HRAVGAGPEQQTTRSGADQRLGRGSRGVGTRRRGGVGGSRRATGRFCRDLTPHHRSDSRLPGLFGCLLAAPRRRGGHLPVVAHAAAPRPSGTVASTVGIWVPPGGAIRTARASCAWTCSSARSASSAFGVTNRTPPEAGWPGVNVYEVTEIG